MKNKKMILLVLMFAVYIVLIVYSFLHIDSFTSAGKMINNKNVSVVIDPGHGGEDGGAVASGVTEKDINLVISKKLAQYLRLSGINVVMTRSSDVMINSEGTTLRERKVSDMKNRLDLYNQSADNIVISVHQNKFCEEQYNGTQVFFSPNNQGSSQLAENIKNNVRALVQPDNKRECKQADRNIYLLYNAKAPSVLVECGFLSNPGEAEKLTSDSYQDKIAFAIYTGFMDYFNSKE